MNRVLVVDDHEANLKLYARVVAQIPESEAFTFISARAALAWSDINDPALVVLDQQMPELSGLEFIALLRQLPGRAETPIIMITGNSDRELRREALQRGASAFLNKPVDPVEFLAIATNFIAHRRSRMDAIARAETHFNQSRAYAVELENRDREELAALFRTVEIRDRRTAEHMARVGLYSERIGKRIGLAKNEVDLLALAARMHDIGKAGIPDRIFYKQGRLTVEDRVIVRKHTTDGHSVFAEARSALHKMAGDIALSHHEHFDGSGYPGGLRSDAIPLAARIVGLADSFAAMTARRPWREALSVGIAMDEIERESGRHFEPRLVGALKDAMPDILEARAKIPDLLPIPVH